MPHTNLPNKTTPAGAVRYSNLNPPSTSFAFWFQLNKYMAHVRSLSISKAPRSSPVKKTNSMAIRHVSGIASFKMWSHEIITISRHFELVRYEWCDHQGHVRQMRMCADGVTCFYRKKVVGSFEPEEILARSLVFEPFLIFFSSNFIKYIYSLLHIYI